MREYFVTHYWAAGEDGCTDYRVAIDTDITHATISGVIAELGINYQPELGESVVWAECEDKAAKIQLREKRSMQVSFGPGRKGGGFINVRPADIYSCFVEGANGTDPEMIVDTKALVELVRDNVDSVKDRQDILPGAEQWQATFFTQIRGEDSSGARWMIQDPEAGERYWELRWMEYWDL